MSVDALAIRRPSCMLEVTSDGMTEECGAMRVLYEIFIISVSSKSKKKAEINRAYSLMRI